jgi:hypothetical protein
MRIVNATERDFFGDQAVKKMGIGIFGGYGKDMEGRERAMQVSVNPARWLTCGECRSPFRIFCMRAAPVVVRTHAKIMQGREGSGRVNPARWFKEGRIQLRLSFSETCHIAVVAREPGVR